MTIRELQLLRTKFNTLKNQDNERRTSQESTPATKQQAMERIGSYCYVIDSITQLIELLSKQEMKD